MYVHIDRLKSNMASIPRTKLVIVSLLVGVILSRADVEKADELHLSDPNQFFTKYSSRALLGDVPTGNIILTKCDTNEVLTFLLGICQVYTDIATGKVVGSIRKVATSQTSIITTYWRTIYYPGNSFCNSTDNTLSKVNSYPTTCFTKSSSLVAVYSPELKLAIPKKGVLITYKLVILQII